MPVDWFDGKYLRREGPGLQLPDRDPVVGVREYGGPGCGLDVRLHLTAAELEALLDVARKSPTRRVVIEQAGLRSTLFRTPAGHQYEVLQLSGLAAKPEQPPIVGGG